MSIPVVFTTPGNLAANYCWTGSQQYLNDIVPLLNANISGLQIIVSASAPGPADQDKLWARLVGGYLEGIYSFLGGWYRPNPVPASGSARQIWTGTEADVWAYDGGDGTDPGSVTPTAVSGAMWQVDHAFDFKFPIGAGTNGTTYDSQPATVILPTGTGGAERVQLADKEVPFHDHNLGTTGGVPAATGLIVNCQNTGTNWGYTNTGGNIYVYRTFSTYGGDPVDFHTWYHANMPPFLGVFFIRRTVRQFYVAT